jgi:MoxR-like ATPase
VLAKLEAICMSEQVADPNWRADPNDPDASAPLIDRDPPTDQMGQGRLTARALKTKAKADARKYSGRTVRTTGIDDVAKTFTTARRQLQKIVAELRAAAVEVSEEEAKALADRQAYAQRNKARLAEQQRLIERNLRRQEAKLKELKAAAS